MKKKLSRKKTWGKTLGISLVIVIILGLGVLTYGVWGLLNLDLTYEKDKLSCDGQDYSAYIEYIRTEKPGNDNINSQLKIVSDALDLARDAGDATAVAQLWEKYNELLALQAQTSTSEGHYDYSKVETAKQKCYSVALKQKESNQMKGIFCTSAGLVLIIVSGTILYVTFRNRKPKKR